MYFKCSSWGSALIQYFKSSDGLTGHLALHLLRACLWIERKRAGWREHGGDTDHTAFPRKDSPHPYCLPPPSVATMVNPWGGFCQLGWEPLFSSHVEGRLSFLEHSHFKQWSRLSPRIPETLDKFFSGSRGVSVWAEALSPGAPCRSRSCWGSSSSGSSGSC